MEFMKRVKENVVGFMKDNKVVSGILALSIITNIVIPFETVSNGEYNDLVYKYNDLVEEYKTNEGEYDKLKEEYNKIYNENIKLNKKVDEAKPWFEMKEEERKAEEERLQKEKEEKERKAREEQEAKEKQGYDTGITYNQLARTPDDYKGKKCKFKGKVVQIMEDSGLVMMRLAVNGDYNNILILTATEDILNEGRILEDDYITVYGTSTGIFTYTSTMGASISMPSVYVDKVDR